MHIVVIALIATISSDPNPHSLNLRTKIPMLPQSIPARITIPDASFFMILPPYIQKG